MRKFTEYYRRIQLAGSELSLVLLDEFDGFLEEIEDTVNEYFPHNNALKTTLVVVLFPFYIAFTAVRIVAAVINMAVEAVANGITSIFNAVIKRATPDSETLAKANCETTRLKWEQAMRKVPLGADKKEIDKLWKVAGCARNEHILANRRYDEIINARVPKLRP